MNKSELITAMSEKSSLSKKDCEAALDAFVSAVGDALKSGDKVQMVGLAPLRCGSGQPGRGAIPRLRRSWRSPLPKRPRSSLERR